jgi:hypothetical protein
MSFPGKKHRSGMAIIGENYMCRGTLADFAVHQPNKECGTQKPYFHVLCPIRPV